MSEPPTVRPSPIGLDQAYEWPYASRLLPDAAQVAALLGPDRDRTRWAPPAGRALTPPAVGERSRANPAVPDRTGPADGRDAEPAEPPVDPDVDPVGAPVAEPVGSRRRSRGARLARLVARAGAWTVLAAIVWMLAWSTLPQLVGWRPTLVVGGSMAPHLNRGDVILVRPVGASGIGPGAVITFADQGRGGRLVTHRVVAVLPDGTYQTRGDHNRDPDPQSVPLAAVRGRAVLRLPYLGRPVIWFQDGRWLPVGAAALGLVALATAARRPPSTRRLHPHLEA